MAIAGAMSYNIQKAKGRWFTCQLKVSLSYSGFQAVRETVRPSQKQKQITKNKKQAR